MVRSFWHSCRLPFSGKVMMRDWVHGVGHSPVCQILLQIVSRPLIMASPLLAPAPLGRRPLLLPLLREGWGSCRCRLLEGCSVLLGFLWLCSCTARSSARTTSIGCPVLHSDLFHPCPVRWWFALALCWSDLSPAGKFSCCYSSSCYLRCPGTALQSTSSLPFHAFLDFLVGCPVLPYVFRIFLLLQLPSFVAQIK